jgi:hypothetical protein
VIWKALLKIGSKSQRAHTGVACGRPRAGLRPFVRVFFSQSMDTAGLPTGYCGLVACAATVLSS